MEKRIEYLYKKCLANTAMPEERHELMEWMKLPENEAISKKLLLNAVYESNSEASFEDWEAEAMIEAIMAADRPGRSPEVHRVHFLKTTWFRYAAAVILVLGVAAVIVMYAERRSGQQNLVSSNQREQTDIMPGRNRAILTLANGQQILLDSTQGNIVKQDSLTVVNLEGTLKYEGLGTTAEYNTLSTPKGGQYQIVLPDGSKVWLNAASSIKFPTAFLGNVRKVELTGEAYMEIARNARQSFTVMANGAEIQVLGTSFNVNAYGDESAVKATLIEGSVKVKQLNSKAVILKPGQQCSMDDNQLSVIDNADIERTLAWKNGWFNFNGASLYDIMRQLERWYDIEVKYEGTIPELRFKGEIDRGVPLSGILNFLALESRIKTRLVGKTLIISRG